MMNKYYDYSGNYGKDDISWQLMPGESVIWKGTPKKGAFVLNAATRKMGIALIWLMFDSFFIFTFLGVGSAVGGPGLGGMAVFLIGFFAIHLMPVWMWIYDIVTAFGRWKNTLYVITTHRVLIRNGLSGGTYESASFEDIMNVSVRVSKVDRMTGVGDVLLALDSMRMGGKVEFAVLDVENYAQVYQMINTSVQEAKVRAAANNNTSGEGPIIVNV